MGNSCCCSRSVKDLTHDGAVHISTEGDDVEAKVLKTAGVIQDLTPAYEMTLDQKDEEKSSCDNNAGALINEGNLRCTKLGELKTSASILKKESGEGGWVLDEVKAHIYVVFLSQLEQLLSAPEASSVISYLNSTADARAHLRSIDTVMLSLRDFVTALKQVKDKFVPSDSDWDRIVSALAKRLHEYKALLQTVDEDKNLSERIQSAIDRSQHTDGPSVHASELKSVGAALITEKNDAKSLVASLITAAEKSQQVLSHWHPITHLLSDAEEALRQYQEAHTKSWELPSATLSDLSGLLAMSVSLPGLLYAFLTHLSLPVTNGSLLHDLQTVDSVLEAHSRALPSQLIETTVLRHFADTHNKDEACTALFSFLQRLRAHAHFPFVSTVLTLINVAGPPYLSVPVMRQVALVYSASRATIEKTEELVPFAETGGHLSLRAFFDQIIAFPALRSVAFVAHCRPKAVSIADFSRAMLLCAFKLENTEAYPVSKRVFHSVSEKLSVAEVTAAIRSCELTLPTSDRDLAELFTAMLSPGEDRLCPKDFNKGLTMTWLHSVESSPAYAVPFATFLQSTLRTVTN